jgi:hypothetical protein
MSQASTTEPKAMVPFKQGALMPESMDGIARLAAGAMAAGVIPSAKTPQQAFILLAAGFEAGLGFTATCKNVMLVNNRPSLWGDAALALVTRSPLCEGVEESVEGTGEALEARCRVVRKGWPKPVERSFGVPDAKKANLWGKAGPWANYPKRMLQMRARAFALRDAFPDLLMGLGVVEEEDDVPSRVTVSSGDGGFGDAPKALPQVEMPDVPDEEAAAKAKDDAAFLASLEQPVESELYPAGKPLVGTTGHGKK